MIFTITNFNKQLDAYQVASDAGQVMNVQSIQIVQVMLQGYTFNNAYLTKKGFGIQTDAGVRYIQVPMNRQLAKAVANFVTAREAAKAEIRAEEKAIAKPKARVKAQNSCLGNRQKVDSNRSASWITYKGQKFPSAESLCRKFNRDVKLFLELKAKGYTMDEALGLVPLRPESQLQPKYNVNKALDSLDNARGEY